MSDKTTQLSAAAAVQLSLNTLDAEIKRLINMRFAEYDDSMQMSSREYFADCVEEFAMYFSTAVSDSSSSLNSIARKIKKQLKVTLMNFFDYIARGMWLLREAPRCKELIEECYFVPETFDVEGLKELISDVKNSVSFENYCEVTNVKHLLITLRTNLLGDLVCINEIIDGDARGRGFMLRRWAAKFRSDVREMRSIYDSQWESSLSCNEDEYLFEVLTELKDSTMDDLEESPFFIKDFSDTNQLVKSIHSMQKDASAADLDKFLYNYALLEFLDEQLEEYAPKTAKLQAAVTNVTIENINISGDNPHIYPNAKNIQNNYGRKI